MGNLSDATNLLNDLSDNTPQQPQDQGVSGDMSVTDNSGNTIKLGEDPSNITNKAM